MLLEFRCKNYKSIRDEVILSMVATSETNLQDTLVEVDNRKVLPVASIYGSNGAGKTNIIGAMRYFNSRIRKSNSIEPDELIPTFPHKSSLEENSSFVIQFISNDIRYAYGFELNSSRVVEEYLYHYKNNRPATIFERDGEEYKFGKVYHKTLSEIKDKFGKPNKLFLSSAAIWAKCDDIINVFKYLKDDIVVNYSIQNSGWMKFTIESIAESENNRKIFTSFLQMLGINIRDVSAKVEERTVSYEDLPFKLSEEMKMIFSEGKEVKHEVMLKYGDLEVNLKDESRGVQKIFEIGGPLLDIISKGKVLVYDELETSLHPFVAKKIVEMFTDKELNTNHAQLIFTTHDTNLLDLNTLRKDEIWFVEKDSCEFFTQLYSLSDLKNIRKDENIEAGYIKGKYGAIPFIGNMDIEKWIGDSYVVKE